MDNDMYQGDCIICSGTLKYDTTGSIEYPSEWLECEDCGQFYEIDGTIITEEDCIYCEVVGNSDIVELGQGMFGN